MNANEQLELWEESPSSEISVGELDMLVNLMQRQRTDYEEKKKTSTDAYAALEQTKGKLQELLEKAGKSKYYVEGVGTVSITSKLQYKFPSDSNDKKEVFDYIKSKSPEALMSMTTINYNTFNSFCNSEFEAAAMNGEVLQIPGVPTPTERKILNFRKG